MFGLRTWAPMASRGSTSTTVYCTANLCASRQLIVDKKKIMHGRGGGHCVRVRTSKLPAPKGMSMLASACLCSAHSSWLRVSCAPPPPPRFITSMRTTLHKNCHIIVVTIVYCILFWVCMGWWQNRFLEFREAENLTKNTFLYAKICNYIQLNLALKKIVK